MSKTQPSYYQNSQGKDLISEMQQRYTKEAFIGFCRGNIEKYVRRFDGKNGIEDLEKAQEYITRLINGLHYFDRVETTREESSIHIPDIDLGWEKMSLDDLGNLNNTFVVGVNTDQAKYDVELLKTLLPSLEKITKRNEKIDDEMAEQQSLAEFLMKVNNHEISDDDPFIFFMDAIKD